MVSTGSTAHDQKTENLTLWTNCISFFLAIQIENYVQVNMTRAVHKPLMMKWYIFKNITLFSTINNLLLIHLQDYCSVCWIETTHLEFIFIAKQHLCVWLCHNTNYMFKPVGQQTLRRVLQYASLRYDRGLGILHLHLEPQHLHMFSP